MAYANGQIPTTALTALATAPGQRLEATAARQWDALARSVRNLHGWTPVLTDSYRPYATQERIFRERYATTYTEYAKGKVDRRRWQSTYWYRRPGTAAAAVPGTSNHGTGSAVDVSALGGFTGTRYAQLAALAPRFGFTNAEGRSIGEPWHWAFIGAFTVSTPITSGSTVTTPTIPGAPAPPTPLEDDMTPAQDAALARVLAIAERQAQIGEALVAYTLDAKGRGFQADSRVLGVLPDKRNPDKTVATVLTTAEGQVLRDDITASTARAVAETSSAFHQLVSLVSGASGTTVDVAALAGAVADALGPDLAGDLVDALATRLKGA